MNAQQSLRPSPAQIRALKRGLGLGTLLGMFVLLPATHLLVRMWVG